MTTSELLDLMNKEARGVYSARAYRNSKDVKVMLVDMHYPDDVDRMHAYIIESAPSLTVEVITCTPLGSTTSRRRLVITGFSR